MTALDLMPYTDQITGIALYVRTNMKINHVKNLVRDDCINFKEYIDLFINNVIKNNAR